MPSLPDCTIESRNQYLEFLGHLNRTGVQYAVLHGWESLRGGNLSDLDIVVERGGLSLLESSMQDVYSVLGVLQYEAAAFAFTIRPKHFDTFCPFNVDVITDYRCRGRILLTARQLLQNRLESRGIYVVGPSEEFIYLLVKKIYEKGTLPKPQLLRLQTLARQLGPLAPTLIAGYFGTKRAKELVNLLLTGNAPKIYCRVQDFQKSLRRTTWIQDPSNPVRFWLAEARRLWIRWRYPVGLSIGVVGADRQNLVALRAEIMQRFPQIFRSCEIYQFPGELNISAVLCLLRFFTCARSAVARAALVFFNINDLRFGRSSLMPSPEISVTFEAMNKFPQVETEINTYLIKRYKKRRHVWFDSRPQVLSQYAKHGTNNTF